MRPEHPLAKVMVAIGTVVVLVLWTALPAGALRDIVIPVDTVVRGDVDEVIELMTVPVEPDEVGLLCQLTVTGENNSSEHPNTDLIVTSAGASLVLPDVEATASGTTRGGGEIVLGETVVIEVRLGAHRVFSGGLTLSSQCAPPATTTTVAPTTTTTVAPPTSVAPTTTEAPADVLAESATVPAPLPTAKAEVATAAQPTFTG